MTTVKFSIKDQDLLNTSYDNELSSGSDFSHPLRQLDFSIPTQVLEFLKNEMKVLQHTFNVNIDNHSIELGKIHQVFDTASLVEITPFLAREDDQHDPARTTQLICFSVARSSVEAVFEIRDDDCVSHYNVDITNQIRSTETNAQLLIEKLALEFEKHNLKLIYPCPNSANNFNTEQLDEECFYPLYAINLQNISETDALFEDLLLTGASFNDLWGRTIVHDAAYAAIKVAECFNHSNDLALFVKLLT